MSTTPEPHTFCDRFLRNIARLRPPTYKTLGNAQTRYLRSFDKLSYITRTYLLGQYVFVHRPPEMLIPAACLGHELRSKLLSKAAGMFRIIQSPPDTVTTNEDSIHNTVFMDRVSTAPDEIIAKIEADKRSIHKNWHEPSSTRLSHNDRTDEAAYPLEQIIRHIGTGNNIRWVIRWYGSQPRDRTV